MADRVFPLKKQWVDRICSRTQFFHSWHSSEQFCVYSVCQPVIQRWWYTMTDCLVVTCKWSKCVFLLPTFMFVCMYSVNAGILISVFCHILQHLLILKLNKVAVEPRSRAYFEAFTFIKEKQRKTDNVWQRFIFQFPRHCLHKKSPPVSGLICSIYPFFFASAQLRFPWMRAETGSSACFSKGSFWEFGSVLDETILFPSEIRWCFSPHPAMTLRFMTHFLVRTREHSQKQKEI